MPKLAIFDSKGNELAGNISKTNSRKIKGARKSGVVFYAKLNQGNEMLAQFFMAQDSSGGRKEQFMAVYEGKFERLEEFEKEIVQLFNSEVADSSMISKRTLQILSVNPVNPGLNVKDLAKRLSSNDQILIKAPRERTAYQIAKFLILEDHEVDNQKFSLGITEGSFRQGFPEPEVEIKVDKSVTGVRIADRTTGTKLNNSGNTEEYSFGNDKPSGPLEWLKSLSPI